MMKKICCMFLAFMMIFTSFFNYTFAIKENTNEGFKGHDIKNLSEKDIGRLKKEVDDFVVELTEGSNDPCFDSCFAFDCMCFSDLISKYYDIKGKIKESKKYMAREYLFASELIDFSENYDYFFGRCELSLYYLKKACKYVPKNEDTKLQSYLVKSIGDAYDLLFYNYKRVKKKKLSDNDKSVIVQMVRNDLPDDQKGLNELISVSRDLFKGYDDSLYDSDILIDKNPDSDDTRSESSKENVELPGNSSLSIRLGLHYGDLFNDDIWCENNTLKDNAPINDTQYPALPINLKRKTIKPLNSSSISSESDSMDAGCGSENWLCSFGFDESKVYNLAYVLEEVLKGNFEFGDKKVHIAFSFFDRCST